MIVDKGRGVAKLLTSRLTECAMGEMDVTFKEKSVIKRKMKDEIVAR